MARNLVTQLLYSAATFSTADRKLRRKFATSHTWNRWQQGENEQNTLFVKCQILQKM